MLEEQVHEPLGADLDVLVLAAGEAAGCHGYLFDGSDLSVLARRVVDRHFAGVGGRDA